jgi:microcystin-dependent protein
MSEPFLAEIRMFAGNFAPSGWALCNGQVLAISQNTALFSLLGTTYGGDGISTFALPNLQGRVPLHQGNGFIIGQQGGTSSVTLLTGQIPSHNHHVNVYESQGGSGTPVGNFLGADGTGFTAPFNSSNTPGREMAPGVLTNTGSGQPHENLQPYLCVNFIIALVGIYPSRN